MLPGEEISDLQWRSDFERDPRSRRPYTVRQTASEWV